MLEGTARRSQVDPLSGRARGEQGGKEGERKEVSRSGVQEGLGRDQAIQAVSSQGGKPEVDLEVGCFQNPHFL